MAAMTSALLQTIGYLTLLALVGFLVFRPRWSQEHILPPYLFLILKVLLPIYFAARIPVGWVGAAELGVPVLVALFFLCIGSIAVQAWLATVVIRAGTRVRRNPPLVTQPAGFVLLAALHNAGFIPLPIMERLAPEPVLLGMFFYLFGFNLVFWSVAVPIIRTGHLSLRRISVRLNPALVGIGIGFLLVLTGVYRYIPRSVLDGAGRIGDIALDGALVALGGALAGIRERITFDREHWVFVGWRMVAFPAVVFLIVALPWPGFGGVFGWGLRLLLVLQAATPPATQTLVVTRALGTPEQVHYAGSMVLFTYLVALVTLPIFIGLATFAFYVPG